MNLLVAFEPFIGRRSFQDRLTEIGIKSVFWREDLRNAQICTQVDALMLMPHKVGSNEPETIKVDAAMLRTLPSLRFIATASTGFDHIDLELCGRAEIVLYNVPNYATDSVAELCVGMTLSLLRKLPQAKSNVQDSRWDMGVVPGCELAGKTVGIIGTGQIGVRVAELFRAFRCEVLGWSKSERREFLSIGGRYVSDIDHIAASCDIISLHLPKSNSTKRIVNQRLLGLMKATTVLVNVSRAALIDTGALTTHLRENLLAGAALDVLDIEPPPVGAELSRLKNVLVTPHIGFKTREALERLDLAMIQNLSEFLSGGKRNRIL